MEDEKIPGSCFSVRWSGGHCSGKVMSENQQHALNSNDFSERNRGVTQLHDAVGCIHDQSIRLC